MNQIKIGELLRELRNSKNLTQEAFAELFNVSNRSVSRWENGKTLPDLDVLILIADYYEIDLRDLLDGEIKREHTNENIKETVLKSMNYANIQTEQKTYKINELFLICTILWMITQFIRHTSLIQLQECLMTTNFLEGITCGLLLCRMIITS